MSTHIATIRSKVLTKIEGPGGEEEDGVFELEVYVSLDAAMASGDPSGFVRHMLGQHIAKCVEATDLPLKEQLWDIHFTPFAQRNFNYPEGATL